EYPMFTPLRSFCARVFRTAPPSAWRRLMRGPVSRPRSSPDRRYQPCVDALEDRQLLTTLTVTTAADNVAAPPPGSLRAALMAANNGDVINFAPGLAGQTIALTGALPALTQSGLTITAAGVSGLIVSGADQFQIFAVNGG